MPRRGKKKNNARSEPYSRCGPQPPANNDNTALVRQGPQGSTNTSGRALVPVARLEERTFTNAQGQVVAIGVINRAGGHQTNFIAPYGNAGGVIGKVNDTKLLAAAAEKLKADTKADEVGFILQPIHRDENAALRMRREIVEMTGGVATSRRKLGRRARELTGAEADAEETVCLNCDSKSHTLECCLFAPTGYIDGCPWCKNQTHRMEDCSNFAGASTYERVRVLIASRPNRPAWKTQNAWHTYLLAYVGTPDFFRGLHQASGTFGLPWTKKFAQQFRNTPKFGELQKEAESGVWQNMPSDPATKDLEAACKTFGFAFDPTWAQDSSAMEVDSVPAPKAPVAKGKGEALREKIAIAQANIADTFAKRAIRAEETRKAEAIAAKAREAIAAKAREAIAAKAREAAATKAAEAAATKAAEAA
ncbi:hypothetical protein FZEAL_7290, partial [Fusarium zealandicum]